MNCDDGVVKNFTEEELDQLTGNWREVDPDNLTQHHQRALEKTGKTKIGRNSPCPCASGKKFKKCCMTGAV